MLEYLKIKRDTLETETLLIKERERHYVNNARALKGKYPKRHQKGTDKPDIPQRTLKAMEVEDAAAKAKRDYEIFWGLHNHRINVVRKEARDTHLALNFLRGNKFSEVEQIRYSNPNFDNIIRMVVKYNETEEDERVIRQRLAEWIDEAVKLGVKNKN